MRTLAELASHLDHIRAAPRHAGVVELIVRRPAQGDRELVEHAELDTTHGLIGDHWLARGSKRTPDGRANPEQQLTLMNVRAIAALADRAHWPLAGDQLYVDLDLSEANLPAGTQLHLGTALVEISAIPHTGCNKFTARFGSDATMWVNGPIGRELRLRGVNARIVAGGLVRRGDSVRCSATRPSSSR
jgi:MOSC domain-containing protein YiiM